MASSLDLFGAIFFGLLSGGIVYLLIRSLLLGLSTDPRVWLEGFRIRKREQLLLAADERMRSNNVGEALALLRSAFFFDHPVHYPATIERIHTLHMQILSRVIGVAKSHSRQIDNLPVVEDLLASRETLLSIHIEHVATRDNLRARRRRDRKQTPTWAIAEFTRKIEEILDKLATNRQSLESQLDRIFLDLARFPVGEEVTYH